MIQEDSGDSSVTTSQNPTRRAWLASALMGIGLVASYGTLAAQVLSFLLPERLKPPTRRLFVGPFDRFEIGGVKTIRDLQGNSVMIRREAEGFKAFSSVCPHLGCRVHWEAEKEEFFCPCHRGVFDANGVATAGPPADAGQSLYPAPIVIDEENRIVYLEVKVPKGRKA